MSVDLRVNLSSLNLKNPLISASGTFGYGLEFAPYGDLKTLGGIIVKGISLKPREGNPPPRIVETPCGMLNAIGLQNIGVEKFLEEKLPLLPEETPVIVNMYAQSGEEFVELARILDKAEKVAALELNISCPNVKKGGVLFGQNPLLAAELTRAVKKVVSKPVMVKLSPNVTDIKEIALAVEEAGADVISLINTLGGMAVDIYRRKPCLKNVFGGLSGPAIKPVALKMVYEVCRVVSVPVVGIGGISKVEDVLEFMLVGASAVQVGTANFMRPDTLFRLVEELPLKMKKLGIKSFQEWIGKLEV
ncbi:MAG: dihydroorotate dehydrogenase catalytic subunit [Desulfonauticus sp.]|jgi:dihydroorotate dehydrogenase (NAD+) catalytic subunit|nr:dihydroorotate dehydrogenase catalytic subunit [Desulfonauticus sp.]